MSFKAIQTHDFDREVLERDSPLVVLFEAEWCPFCTSFSAVLNQRADKIPMPVLAVLLNDDDDPLWDRYSIEAVPTLAVFDGGEIVFRIDGVLGIGLDNTDVSRLIEQIKSRNLTK